MTAAIVCACVVCLMPLQVRLTFKPESQQLWIASATSTQKSESCTGCGVV